MDLSKYEDIYRQGSTAPKERYSPYCDFRMVKSSITPGVVFAVKICKPGKPSYIKAGTHGWHMSIKGFEHLDEPRTQYLTVDVDMRGRAYSNGTPDCNGYELYDVLDAINFVRKEYKQYLINEDTVYFESGSGGGGNALAIAGKFPDLFCAVNALSPISDYYDWYIFDSEYGEFRDEMDIWIAPNPDQNTNAYASRSGITLIPNILSQVLICHGTHDLRVPYSLTDKYMTAVKSHNMTDRIKLFALEGVGTREHFGNITPSQQSEMNTLCTQNLKDNTEPLTIPGSGQFVVCGYLITKVFSVFLGSIDSINTLTYDISSRTLVLRDYDANARITWNI